MNKNKNKSDLALHKHKNTLDNKILTSNIYPLKQEKSTNNDLISHYKLNKIKDNDCTDLTNIVRNSVEKINNLFSQTEFQTKKYYQKSSKNVDEYEEMNKSIEIKGKEKERASTLKKSSKANFTFNINNFINMPNISTTLPNMSQDKNNNENNDKISIKNSKKNKKKIYLNTINNKKNLLIENKGISNKRLGVGLSESHNCNYNNNNNNSTINDSLYQINEVQNVYTSTTTNANCSLNNKKMINLKNSNNPKNMKISVLNAKMSKANYNTNIRPDLSKSTKEVKDFNINNTHFIHNENFNSFALAGLTTSNQSKKVLYRMPNNNKKKENKSLNTAQTGKESYRNSNRVNKYKRKQNEMNQNAINKNINIKKNNNNDLIKNNGLKNKNVFSQSKKLFSTGENFHSIKSETEKEKNEINTNKSINIDEITTTIRVKQNQREDKNKIPNVKNTINITVKTMDDLNNNKFNNNNNINTDNINDQASIVNSPINLSGHKIKKRGRSNYERKLSEKNERGSSYNSSNRMFHHVINYFYDKEFPKKINTNEILKLMLFLNEYLINNNLLNDYYERENQKLLNDYSKYISSKIKVDFPQEHDIVVDPSIKCIKKIQRKWRKRKIEKYLEKNKKNEKIELKQMIVNKYIKKSGYKIKKILGLFNTIAENFDNINKQPDINELFYRIQKIIHNKLTEYEKNLLYKEFINNVIFHNL